MDNVKCYWGHCSNTKCFLVYVLSHFDFGYFKFSFDLILSYCINLYLLTLAFFGSYYFYLTLVKFRSLVFFTYYVCASKGGYFHFLAITPWNPFL